MNPEKIERQIDLFTGISSEVGLIYSDAELIDSESNSLKTTFIHTLKNSYSSDTFPWLISPPNGWVLEKIVDLCFIPAMSILTKTKILHEIGGFDESLKYEDHETWIRIAKRYKFFYSDYTSVRYRKHKNSFTSLTKDFDEYLFYIYLKHLDIKNAKYRAKEIVIRSYKSDKKYSHSISKMYLRESKEIFLILFLSIIGFKYSYFNKIVQIKNQFNKNILGICG